MPLMRCTRDGKPGWKWGDAGFCFTTEDAQEKARQQGVAVLASEAKAAGAKSKESVSEYISSHAARELSTKKS